MVYKSGADVGNKKVPLIVNAEFNPVGVEDPNMALHVQLAKLCPPVVNTIPVPVPETEPPVTILDVEEPVIVPPLVGVEIAPVNVTKLLTPVGNTKAPAVNVVVPLIISVLLEIVVPVAAVGLLIVKAATVVGINAPVTCDAVALLKVKLVVVGKVIVPLVVKVPLTPNVLAVVNEPDVV